ncbi:MAG: hypothetical protein U0893_05395 [Chloroflexota bacterium]
MATSEVEEAAEARSDPAAKAVPIWGQVAGAMLILAFMLAGFEAFAGPGLRYRLLGLAAGDTPRAAAIPSRVLYQPDLSVRAGMKSVGSEGQERTLLEGDTVLLGESGALVRLDAVGRVTTLPAPDGATTLVANLGAWDKGADRLGGVTARVQGGRWVLDPMSLPSVGAALHPPGAPSEALTDGFWLGPDPDAGRVRRVGDRGSPAVRIRASNKLPALALQTRQPLDTLDGVLVSVSAVVRGMPGKTVALVVTDAIDGSGGTEAVVDRRPATEEWATLTVRRRMVYPSGGDTISVQLLNVDGGDWFEVRSLDVRLGVSP